MLKTDNGKVQFEVFQRNCNFISLFEKYVHKVEKRCTVD